MNWTGEMVEEGNQTVLEIVLIGDYNGLQKGNDSSEEEKGVG